MRIRKRQVPFPATLSDPNLINRSPVLVQLNDATTTSPKPSCTLVASATAPISISDRPQPSDQPLPPIGKPTNGFDDSFGGRQQKKQECLVEDGRGQERGGGQKGNDTRKGSILGAEMSTEVIISPSSPSTCSKQGNKTTDWRWCEGEKAFPLKKRRGSFENNNINNDDNNNKKKMKMKSRMKTKMNKKGYDSNEGDQEEEEVVVVVRETKAEVNVRKKKVRGGALMEGSRCSRVNGRGWRCCQPTLVGYSLCEHHLGKGRLRSMTSVRNRSVVAAAPKSNNMQEMPLSESSSLSLEKQTKCDAEENNEKKPLVITKKRMKLGMVKARSMSSLLGQTNTENAIAENN